MFGDIEKPETAAVSSNVDQVLWLSSLYEDYPHIGLKGGSYADHMEFGEHCAPVWFR